MDQPVRDFLKRHQMEADAIDWQQETQRFVRQMQAGLEGETSSLLMIPSFVMMAQQLPLDRKAIVVDAGGTNLRVAVAQTQADGSVELSGFVKYPMPGTQGQLTADEFFCRLADRLEPVLEQSDQIGICFSFPCEILPNRDGRILGFSKEVRVSEAAGRLIGESLNAEFARRGKKAKTFTVLNDTVATMLGGLAAAGGRRYDNYIGFILGTGTNTCYVERSERIRKSPEACAMGGEMAMNTESGCYDGFAQGTFDRMVDQASDNPGDHPMEKMISGVYQGKIITCMVQAAVEEGLFTDTFAREWEKAPRITPMEMDAFVAAPKGEGRLAAMTADSQDNVRLYQLIEALYQRAAKITTVVFSGIAVYTGIPAGGSLCVMAEGSVFEKSALYVEKLREYIRCYMEGKLQVHCDIVTGRNTTLVGTAAAALLQQ